MADYYTHEKPAIEHHRLPSPFARRTGRRTSPPAFPLRPRRGIEGDATGAQRPAVSKNASVIRKHLGYSHIPEQFATQVNVFTQVLTPYINFHRPCFFPEVTLDDKGRQRRRYPYQAMNTPYEKLKSLPDAARHLRPGITFQQLDQEALAMTDSQAAERLNQARKTLFDKIFKSTAA